MDLALNNLQWLICYKTKPNQSLSLSLSLSLYIYIYIYILYAIIKTCMY